MHYISILSTVVVIIFALAVFDRYRRRGGTHLLLWGIGLLFFGLGTLSEAIMLFTFNEVILKLWYFSGAMMTAAWLGQGTVYLLVRKRKVARSLTFFLFLFSLVALAFLVFAPVTPAAASFDLNQPASAQYKDILVRGSGLVVLTIFLNVYGTIALVGGAIYSAFLFWRKRVLPNRMLGNILIATGALLLAIGGTFIRVGIADWLYVSEFLGAVILFAGFIVATAEQPLLLSNESKSLPAQ
ncbi:MAG: hypothetical protein IBX69_11955 [Anaerolineales bacterium]|nr:hypothetical protein [Anaerolineales bacterium]